MQERVIEKLWKMKACNPALVWATQYNTKQEAWNQCRNACWMGWLLIKLFNRRYRAGTMSATQKKKMTTLVLSITGINSGIYPHRQPYRIRKHFPIAPRF